MSWHSPRSVQMSWEDSETERIDRMGKVLQSIRKIGKLNKILIIPKMIK